MAHLPIPRTRVSRGIPIQPALVYTVGPAAHFPAYGFTMICPIIRCTSCRVQTYWYVPGVRNVCS